MLNRLDRRAGITLIELVASIVVSGIVLALVAAIALRQRRAFIALVNDAALGGQLRDAASILPADVRAASITGGDLRETTDTSLEVRETIASAVVCDTLAGSVVLAPVAPGEGAFAAGFATAAATDTAWVLTPFDSAARWRPYRIAASVSARAGQCLAAGPRVDLRSLGSPRLALTLDSAGAPLALVGRPLRITRPIRFSVYRSSDGRWYLGARDWNSGTSRFNTVQPLAGPFQAPTLATPVFQWFDTAGVRRSGPGGVATLLVALRGQTLARDFVLGAGADSGAHRDSVRLFVSTRNRR